MKKIIILSALISSIGVFAQVKTNNVVSSNTITNQTPFLDASSSLGWNGTNNQGKGMVFPRTDLTAMTALVGIPNGLPTAYPTRMDGMVVYNTATGTAGLGGGTVSPGFYYYENKTTNLQGGKWVRIGGDAQTAAANAWVLGGNTTIQQATLDANNMVTNGNYMGTQDGHAIVFATKGTVGSGSTATTGNIARLIIGGDGAGNIIKETTVGGTKQFDFALKVFGKARFTEGIVTSKSTYPDYVFDNYFTGKSEVNPSYQFMKLDEVEQFIKENNHLPGVTKIDDLSKDGDAYMVDVSETSIQTLEKVEELYLHVIEQQKQIKALKAEIAELKKK